MPTFAHVFGVSEITVMALYKNAKINIRFACISKRVRCVYRCVYVCACLCVYTKYNFFNVLHYYFLISYSFLDVYKS